MHYHPNLISFQHQHTALQIAKERGFYEIVEIIDNAGFLNIRAPLYPWFEVPNTTSIPSFDESISLAMSLDITSQFYLNVKQKSLRSFKVIEGSCLFTKEDYQAIFLKTLAWRKSEDLSVQLNRDITNVDSYQSASKWKYYIYYLLKALRKVPSWDGRSDLYKAIPENVRWMKPFKYVKGNVITWKAFTSTYQSKMTAQQWVRGQEFYTQFVITGKTSGRMIERFSCFQNEKEVLFAPGSTFKIVEIKEMEGYDEIHLEQVRNSEQQFHLEDGTIYSDASYWPQFHLQLPKALQQTTEILILILQHHHRLPRDLIIYQIRLFIYQSTKLFF